MPQLVRQIRAAAAISPSPTSTTRRWRTPSQRSEPTTPKTCRLASSRVFDRGMTARKERKTMIAWSVGIAVALVGVIVIGLVLYTV
jgi:hypothetical protein